MPTVTRLGLTETGVSYSHKPSISGVPTAEMHERDADSHDLPEDCQIHVDPSISEFSKVNICTAI